MTASRDHDVALSLSHVLTVTPSGSGSESDIESLTPSSLERHVDSDTTSLLSGVKVPSTPRLVLFLGVLIAIIFLALTGFIDVALILEQLKVADHPLDYVVSVLYNVTTFTNSTVRSVIADPNRG